MQDPASILSDAGGVFSSRGSGSTSGRLPTGGALEEVRLPISALLARIRKLIPSQKNDHYDEIVRGFGLGTLRVPPTPMSDGELARAIAAFLKDVPSAETVSDLGRRLDPSSGI